MRNDSELTNRDLVRIALRERGRLAPRHCQDATGLTHASFTAAVAQLIDRGEIERCKQGSYRLAITLERNVA